MASALVEKTFRDLQAAPNRLSIGHYKLAAHWREAFDSRLCFQAHAHDRLIWMGNLQLPSMEVRHVHVKAGVRIIGEAAWRSCLRLQVVHLPSTVAACRMEFFAEVLHSEPFLLQSRVQVRD